MMTEKNATINQANHLIGPETATRFAFVAVDSPIDDYVRPGGNLSHPVCYSTLRKGRLCSLATGLVFACTVTVRLMTLRLPATGGPVALGG